MADPTALYSYKGAPPTTLPHKIRLSGGRVRTDVSSFSDEEIADAGYTGPYTIPSHNSKTQNLFWNSETLSFVVEDKSEDEIWSVIRSQRDRLLAESDWTMVADAPGEINLSEWMKYRQRLRDIPSQFSNPEEVIFPVKPSDQESFDSEVVIEDRLRFRVEDMENLLSAVAYRANQPYESWKWNYEIGKWEAPTSAPDDYNGSNYKWDEPSLSWVLDDN